MLPLAQDHTVRKQWSQESNPDFRTVSSIVNRHTPTAPHHHPQPLGSRPYLFQTWVLWKHSKDCVQVQTNFTR